LFNDILVLLKPADYTDFFEETNGPEAVFPGPASVGRALNSIVEASNLQRSFASELKIRSARRSSQRSGVPR